MPVNFSKQGAANSILSDYMITIFQIRYSGMDAGAEDREANPGSMDGLSLPSMALDTRFPAGMTSLRII